MSFVAVGNVQRIDRMNSIDSSQNDHRWRNQDTPKLQRRTHHSDGLAVNETDPMNMDSNKPADRIRQKAWLDVLIKRMDRCILDETLSQAIIVQIRRPIPILPAISSPLGIYESNVRGLSRLGSALVISHNSRTNSKKRNQQDYCWFVQNNVRCSYLRRMKSKTAKIANVVGYNTNNARSSRDSAMVIDQ